MGGLSRQDGRGGLEYREVEVVTGVLEQCYGSSKVVIGGGLGGGTEVLCAVTASVGSCVAEGCGDVEVHVECCASMEGAWDDRARAARSEALGARLRGALAQWRAAVAPALHVATTFAWRVAVDCVVFADDGAVLEALSLAVRAAAADCELPATAAVAGDDAERAFELGPETEPRRRLDVGACPVVVCLHRRGGALAADVTPDEGSDAAVAVAVTAGGDLGAIDLVSGTFSPAEMADAFLRAPDVARPFFEAAAADTGAV